MKYFIFFWLLSSALVMNAQELSFQHSENIKQLKKDQSGLLYILGNTSVCKFDGKDFGNCLYLDDNINDALIISEQDYYLASNNKLIHFRNNENIKEILIDEVITTLDYFENQIIIGTLGSGLYTYSISKQDLTHHTYQDFVNDVLVIGDNIYVITDTELKKYDGNFKLINTVAFPNDTLKQIQAFDEDNIAVLTNSSSILFLDNNLKIYNTFTDEYFKPIQLSGSKGLLFAIDKQQLKEWTGNGFKLISKGKFEQMLDSETLVFTSHSNILTSKNILFQVYNLDKTFSVFAEGDRFWLGGEGKISKFYEGEIQDEIKFPKAYGDIYVSSLVVYNDKIYAGTMGRGILVFNAINGKFLGSFQQNNSSLSEQNVIQLVLKDNLLWKGYLNGLKAFDLEAKVLKYDFTELLENNYLYRFHVISPNNLYLCTSDNGLLHVVNGKSKAYLEDSSVFSLTETPSGIIFSAEEKGVFMLNNTLIKLSDEYFFRSENVYNILSLRNNILLAHDFGIDVFNTKTKRISYLSFDDLNEAQLNAYAIGESKLLLGYENGILELDKNLMERVYVNDFTLKQPLLFNSPVKVKDEFSYKEHTWTFEYGSKSYSLSNENYYKYRLIPIEDQWISTTQEKITYYNLPPGDYTFEVSYGGNRNFKPTHFEVYNFSIAKPFWQELYFWILSLCVFIILIYSYIRYREKKIQKKEEIKNIQLEYEYQRLKDQINPHFLFNSFNSIIGVVEENPKQAAKILEKLSSLFRTILQFDKTEVIPLSEELDLMTKYFEIHQLRFQDLIQLQMSEIQDRQNKYVIPFSLQLLVENAIKHNVINSKKVLQITITDQEGFIVVSNNRNPKKNNSNSLGLGLQNLMRRHDMKMNKKPIVMEGENHFIVKIPYIYD